MTDHYLQKLGYWLTYISISTDVNRVPFAWRFLAWLNLTKNMRSFGMRIIDRDLTSSWRCLLQAGSSSCACF